MKIEVTAKNLFDLPKGRYSLGNGLTLLVSSATSRSWVVRYTFHGKRVDFSVGSANYLTISEAKAKAKDILHQVAQGFDPREERAASRSTIAENTFEGFALEAVKELQDVRRWKNAKHAEQWLSTLNAYAFPRIGKLRIEEITREDVLSVLKPIWTTKTETANRLRGRLESIFDHAIAKGLIQSNPAIWKGGLSSFLPQASKVRDVKHHEAMTLATLRDFAPKTAEKTSVISRATLFGILTATRVQEFLGARWDEIDFDRATWTIPASRMKCGIEHRVPLSRQALRIIEQCPRKSDLVFPAPRADKAMCIDSPRTFIRKATGEAYTMHGFRSTFRDWCEENFIHEALAERSLAHVKGDKVVQAYQRSDLLEQRRPVMQRWADVILPDL